MCCITIFVRAYLRITGIACCQGNNYRLGHVYDQTPQHSSGIIRFVAIPKTELDPAGRLFEQSYPAVKL